MTTDTDTAVEQAWQNLEAKLQQDKRDWREAQRQPMAYEQYAVSLLRSAGAELYNAAESLQAAAEALKFAGKGKDANLAIKASRRAREAAQGLV